MAKSSIASLNICQILMRCITYFRIEENVTMFFDLCRTENGKISVGAFLEELARFGILSDDPRLEQMMFLLNKLKPNSGPNFL